MASDFDTNTWYSIRFNSSTGNGLKSSGNYFFGTNNGPYGSAFLSPYNDSDSNFHWQFFPSPQNHSQYIIRPAAANPVVYLAGIQQNNFPDCGDECSSTTVGVTNQTNDNAVWTASYGDGTNKFLTNSKNGTDWLMAVDTSGKVPGSYLNMGQNKSQALWQFKSVGQINDKRFSTLAAGFTSSADSSTPTTSSGSSIGSSHKTSHKKNNIGAIVGGAVGGFIVLLALVLALLWFIRHRRKSRQEHHEQLPAYEVLQVPDHVDKKEFPYSDTRQRGDSDVYEAPADNAIVEVPSDERTGMGHSSTDPTHRSDVFEMPADDARRNSSRGKPMK